MALALMQSESHIVVVDARPEDYHDLACLAGERQWHVHLLTTARAAITFNGRARADLWFINACLPEMSGFALCEILEGQVRRGPAFIISDQYEPEHERLACQCGVAYLAKSPGHSIDCRWLLQLLANRNSDQGFARWGGPTSRLASAG